MPLNLLLLWCHGLCVYLERYSRRKTNHSIVMKKNGRYLMRAVFMSSKLLPVPFFVKCCDCTLLNASTKRYIRLWDMKDRPVCIWDRFNVSSRRWARTTAWQTQCLADFQPPFDRCVVIRSFRTIKYVIRIQSRSIYLRASALHMENSWPAPNRMNVFFSS